jgi:hypothetical protein
MPLPFKRRPDRRFSGFHCYVWIYHNAGTEYFYGQTLRTESIPIYEDRFTWDQSQKYDRVPKITKYEKTVTIRHFCRLLWWLWGFYYRLMQKPDEVQTFDDVFDVSGIMDLNQRIDTSNSLSSLAGLFENADLNMGEGISASKLEQMYTFLEKNIALSASETDKLLRNDPEALLQVLNRFGNLPAEFGDKNMNFDDLEQSSLGRYLVVPGKNPVSNIRRITILQYRLTKYIEMYY